MTTFSDSAPRATPANDGTLGPADPLSTTTDPVALAFLGVVSAVANLRAVLGDNLLTAQLGTVLTTSIPGTLVDSTVGKMAKILQSFPGIRTLVDPAALQLGLLRWDAMTRARDAVNDLQGKLDYTARFNLNGLWKDTRDAYCVARRESKTDGSLADALAPIVSLLKPTPRNVAAARDATTQALKAIDASNAAADAADRLKAAQARHQKLNPNSAVISVDLTDGAPKT